MYLAHFAFFEYDLLQTRFISAGILTLFLPAILILWKEKNEWLFSKRDRLVKFVLYAIWIVFFGGLIFPHIPQHLGGSKPKISSVVASTSTLENLSIMGVTLADAGEGKQRVQTIPMCKIYQNRDSVIFGVVRDTGSEIISNRVLILNKVQVEAESVTPDDPQQYTQICRLIREVYGIKEGVVTETR
ncbi:MAG: hypothetical protein AAB364_00330 [Patescibacteria group bacterium]